MRIIMPGELKRMSAIIGICGENFCSFIADGRRVTNDGNGGIKITDEKYQKIFKINDNVLFGAAGWFNREEELLDPLKVFVHPNYITLSVAYKAIIEHVEKNGHKMAENRMYLVGGKDNKGRFCIYEIFLNRETHEPITVRRMPEPPSSNFCISCAMPYLVARRKDEFLDKISQCVLTSIYHKDMLDKVSNVIAEMSEIDETVGKEVFTLTIT